MALKKARQHAYIYRLSPDEYLLVPANALPAERTTFLDSYMDIWWLTVRPLTYTL